MKLGIATTKNLYIGREKSCDIYTLPVYPAPADRHHRDSYHNLPDWQDQHRD